MGGVGYSTTPGVVGTYLFSNSLSRSFYGITADTQGNVWFLETVKASSSGASTYDLEIGEVTPSEAVSEYMLMNNVSSSLSSGGGMTTGLDGRIYFTVNNEIGVVTPGANAGSSFTLLQNPTTGSLTQQNEDITRDANGDFGYTQQTPAAIVRLVNVSLPSPTQPTPTPTPTPTTTPTPTPTTQSPTTSPTPTSSGSLTGMLNPASDTGTSSSDGTNDNEPNFTGTATSGSAVTLFALATGSLANAVSIGQEVVSAAGTWSFTPSSPLADGLYVITATASLSGGSSSTIKSCPARRKATW